MSRTPKAERYALPSRAERLAIVEAFGGDPRSLRTTIFVLCRRGLPLHVIQAMGSLEGWNAHSVRRYVYAYDHLADHSEANPPNNTTTTT